MRMDDSIVCAARHLIVDDEDRTHAALVGYRMKSDFCCGLLWYVIQDGQQSDILPYIGAQYDILCLLVLGRDVVWRDHNSGEDHTINSIAIARRWVIWIRPIKRTPFLLEEKPLIVI